MSTPTTILSAEQLDDVLRDETSFAMYLSTLSIPQIVELRHALQTKKINVPEPVAQSFLKLLEITEGCVRELETDVATTILPLAHGIAVAMSLHDQIQELERLSTTL